MALIRRIVRARGTQIPEPVATKLSQHLLRLRCSVETINRWNTKESHATRNEVQDIQSSLSLLTGFSAVFFVEKQTKGQLPADFG